MYIAKALVEVCESFDDWCACDPTGRFVTQAIFFLPMNKFPNLEAYFEEAYHGNYLHSKPFDINMSIQNLWKTNY